MTHTPVPFDEFNLNIHNAWNNQWFLLTCGDFSTQDFNNMTVSWGSLGTLWHKPMTQLFVRKSRFTFDFLERFDTFTLSAFSKDYQKELTELGSKSGRKMDKIHKSGLTPIASQTISAPGYLEAETILECKKAYWQDMNISNILDEEIIQKFYSDQGDTRIYFGEILAIFNKSK
ncbi:MAG: flavin reductase [Anaerolineaceae bacterium]|nr:flavin reductase [Anaerolineaceae bacterium]